MTYNHAFSLGFAVAKSNHEDPAKCWEEERDKVITALLLRVASLMSDQHEYLSGCDPFDTYEETP